MNDKDREGSKERRQPTNPTRREIQSEGMNNARANSAILLIPPPIQCGHGLGVREHNIDRTEKRESVKVKQEKHKHTTNMS